MLCKVDKTIIDVGNEIEVFYREANFPTSMTLFWNTTNTEKIHLTKIQLRAKETDSHVKVWDTDYYVMTDGTSGEKTVTKTIDKMIDTSTPISWYAYSNSSSYYAKKLYLYWYKYRYANGNNCWKWKARELNTIWIKTSITIFGVHSDGTRRNWE